MSSHVRSLVIVLRRNERGEVYYAADLTVAQRCATARTDNHTPRLITARPAGTVREWAATAIRSRPHTVLLLASIDTIAVRDFLADELHHAGVRVCQATMPHHGAPIAETEVPTELEPFFADPVPDASPYRTDIVPARLAPELGIPLQGNGAPRSTADVFADVAHLARHSYASMTVPLVGGTRANWLDAGMADELNQQLTAPIRRQIALRPQLAAADIDAKLAEQLAPIADGGVIIDVGLTDGSERELRRALTACARHQLPTHVEIDVPLFDEVDTPIIATGLAQLLGVVPDAQVNANLATLRSLAAQGALVGSPPQAAMAFRLRAERRDLLRQLRGSYAGSYLDVPITAGVHDLWWGHRDQASRHHEWIAAVVSAGGALLTMGGTESSVAHIRVNDPRTVTSSRVRNYADLGLAATMGPQFVWLETPDDAAAFCGDLESAWHDGVLRDRLFDPDVHIAGLCRWGLGQCAGGKGRQLYVDDGGMVRTGPSGPVVGAVGDDLGALRSAVRALPDRFPRLAATECQCWPQADSSQNTLFAGELMSSWWRRVLTARAAVAALGRDGTTVSRAAEGPRPRISGCGGPILHSVESSVEWIYDVALLQWESVFYLYSSKSERINIISQKLAFLIELLLDNRDSNEEYLKQHHGIEPPQSQVLFRRTEKFLDDMSANAPTDSLRNVT